MFAAILTAVLYWAAVLWGFDEWDKRGLFGDMFGGLNALFSGLALVGVVVAVLVLTLSCGLDWGSDRGTNGRLIQNPKALVLHH